MIAEVGGSLSRRQVGRSFRTAFVPGHVLIRRARRGGREGGAHAVGPSSPFSARRASNELPFLLSRSGGRAPRPAEWAARSAPAPRASGPTRNRTCAIVKGDASRKCTSSMAAAM